MLISTAASCKACDTYLAQGNIRFPQSHEALQICANAFARLSRAVPNVIAAVDGVIFETVAPTATPFDKGEKGQADHTAIGQDFNRCRLQRASSTPLTHRSGKDTSQ